MHVWFIAAWISRAWYELLKINIFAKIKDSYFINSHISL